MLFNVSNTIMATKNADTHSLRKKIHYRVKKMRVINGDILTDTKALSSQSFHQTLDQIHRRVSCSVTFSLLVADGQETSTSKHMKTRRGSRQLVRCGGAKSRLICLKLCVLIVYWKHSTLPNETLCAVEGQRGRRKTFLSVTCLLQVYSAY